MTIARLKHVSRLTRTVGEPQEERPYVALEHIEGDAGRLLSGVALPLRHGGEPGAVSVEFGDVLFGKLRPYLAKSLLADRPMYASSEFLAMRAGALLEPRYLAYLALSKPFVTWAVATSDGTKMPRTRWDALADLTVHLPNRRDQRRIAHFLDDETARIDALIEKKSRIIELLSKRVWHAFAEDVRQAEHPEVQLRRTLTAITDGPFGSAFTSTDYADEGAAVVRLGNIGFATYRHEEQAFIPLELYQSFLRHRVLPNDLLIAGLGDAKNHAGRACAAPDLGPAIVKGKCFCARVNDDVASVDYVALLLSSGIGADAVGMTSRGSTRSMINLDIVKSTVIPLPPLPTQHEIVERAKLVEKRTWEVSKVLERQSELLGEHRQALITAAVTGQLDVRKAAA